MSTKNNEKSMFIAIYQSKNAGFLLAWTKLPTIVNSILLGLQKPACLSFYPAHSLSIRGYRKQLSKKLTKYHRLQQLFPVIFWFLHIRERFFKRLLVMGRVTIKLKSANFFENA